MRMTRPTWDEYFLEIAQTVSLRADCTRSKVGAVIVKDNRIVATGYNGAPAGHRGCLTDDACPRGRMSTSELPPDSSYDTGAGSCIALHAEQNAILYCSYEQRLGATLYSTREPCLGCAKMIKGSGLARVITPTSTHTYHA